jgi:spore germination cell wall hydrolase CwlJ-like protein
MIKDLYFYKLFITKFQNACTNYVIYFMVVLGVVLTCNTVKATDRPEDMGCLVEAIYFEGRSESLSGMLAIGVVILNRVRSDNYPNTICDVVHDGHYWNGNPIKYKCAFTYWCDGKPERYNNIKALAKVQEVVILLMDGVTIEGIDFATHYHANYVSPYWAYSEDFIYVGRIGRHLFYETVYDN